MNCRFILLCAISLLATLSGLTSCIYEDEKPCACELRFRYDYNMEFADAFPSQVETICLYVFDGDGKFITRYTETGGPFGNGYSMKLNLQPGHYRMVAWCGSGDFEECYDLPDLQPGQSSIDEARLALRNVADGKISKMLSPLWHGMITDFEVTGKKNTVYTMPLVKDTKTFRVLVQDANGKPINTDRLDLSIRSANGTFNFDNTIPNTASEITYLPYVLQQGEIENGDATNGVAVAELGTLRLIEDAPVRFALEAKGSSILDVNLTDYLKLMKSEEYSSMPLQEYLDRESRYQIILFLSQKADGTYMAVAIQINAWRYIFNETGL